MAQDLRSAAEAWLAEDPDPDTQAELRALLEGGDEAAIADRFGARLTFGTAGIRGSLGAGPNRMNRAVVRRVSAGLAAVLREVDGAAERGVVVGRDARHKSDLFAQDAARVLSGAGLAVRRFAQPVPTPLVAFAVRELGAAAGVVVTASHNPPGDNGYKVYWGDGAQITAPLDSHIAAAIDAVGGPTDAPLADGRVSDIGPEVREAYLQAALGLQLRPHARDLRIAVTPLHGVAGDLLTELLERAGFADVHVVAEQARPDPDFPTVAFPNPEEPGALDRVLALAREVDAELVLANDPDGDRIAAAVPASPAREADGDGARWRLLSGDETGCVLAEDRLAHGSGANRMVATTVVSSQLLSQIAEHHGVGYAETLTGFKWLAPLAAQAEAHGTEFVLAYEQALGVMVGDAVRDKDGISAALALADLAAGLKAEGGALPDALDDLAWRHGLHVTAGRSVRVDGPAGARLAAEALTRLRAGPPVEVHGVPVTTVTDYARDPVPTPPTDLVTLALSDGSRLQVRPSGTEPLLKFYAEVVEPVAGGQPVAAARSRAQQRVAGLLEAFIRSVGLDHAA